MRVRGGAGRYYTGPDQIDSVMTNCDDVSWYIMVRDHHQSIHPQPAQGASLPGGLLPCPLRAPTRAGWAATGSPPPAAPAGCAPPRVQPRHQTISLSLPLAAPPSVREGTTAVAAMHPSAASRVLCRRTCTATLSRRARPAWAPPASAPRRWRDRGGGRTAHGAAIISDGLSCGCACLPGRGALLAAPGPGRSCWNGVHAVTHLARASIGGLVHPQHKMRSGARRIQRDTQAGGELGGRG